jgi:SAM-dependent methyltransferase
VSDHRQACLSRAWDEAADHYERYLVPRFAPWVADAVDALPAELPAGPVLVPCCGTFPELPVIAVRHPDREIVGMDLSSRMVEHARGRAAAYPHADAIRHDAGELTSRWPATAAAVVSVFGLQQLPDPVGAITNWVAALQPGGWLSVVYWPPVSERTGPFALLDAVLEQDLGAEPVPDWPGQLAGAARAVGARVVDDAEVSHPMSHPDAATFWSGMTEGGPLRSLVLARGEEFVDALRTRFLNRAPVGPWHHRPTARLVFAMRH